MRGTFKTTSQVLEEQETTTALFAHTMPRFVTKIHPILNFVDEKYVSLVATIL